VRLGNLSETALNAVASAVYVVAAVVIVGRALNSQMAMNLSGRPFIGPPSEAIRRAWNQVYDVSGQD
jgi:hypothetical protein